MVWGVGEQTVSPTGVEGGGMLGAVGYAASARVAAGGVGVGGQVATRDAGWQAWLCLLPAVGHWRMSLRRGVGRRGKAVAG